MEKNNDESNESFADRIQAAIAEEMSIAKTNFTKFDKVGTYQFVTFTSQ